MIEALPFPAHQAISSKLSWIGPELQHQPQEFMTVFSAQDIESINEGLSHFKSLNLARSLASPETFPLSVDVVKKLRLVTDNIYEGRGFHIIRGLVPTNYNEEDRVVLYAGLTSYIASTRARNIDHIRDMRKRNPNNEVLKPNELMTPMSFHTDIDVKDILSMFSQTTPLKGGAQLFASAASIYNLLLKEDPAVLQTLGTDWYWERGFRPEKNQTVVKKFSRPLMAFDQEGRLQVHYAGTFLGANKAMPLSSSAPPLTSLQKKALDALQAAAARVSIRHEPLPGDMIFVNNYALLHAREGWLDSEDDVQNQRYIMRLWLHDEKKGWSSAPNLKRDLAENFDLPPEKQTMMTAEEWQGLPRGMRVKSLGVSGNDCHD